jgi:hypothetical protein
MAAAEALPPPEMETHTFPRCSFRLAKNFRPEKVKGKVEQRERERGERHSKTDRGRGRERDGRER